MFAQNLAQRLKVMCQKHFTAHVEYEDDADFPY